MEYCNKDAYLWSVLPLSGITSAMTPFGTVTNLPTTILSKSRLFGIPYPNTFQSLLSIINFTNSSLLGPITNSGPLLFVFSRSAILKVKWKVIGAPADIKVGFYTSNWLVNGNETNYYLFPTNKGISLFEGLCGEFTTTDLAILSVIIEGSYGFEMEISYSNPKSVTFPDRPLFITLPFATWKHELIMTAEMFDSSRLSTLIKPVPKYFNETLTRLDFLQQFSVNLIFNSTPLLSKQYNLSTTQLVTTYKYGRQDFAYNDNVLFGINSTPYFGNAVNEAVRNNLKRQGLIVSEYGTSISLKAGAIPGVNTITVVSGTFYIDYHHEFYYNLPQNNPLFVFGDVYRISFAPYLIRGLPCQVTTSFESVNDKLDTAISPFSMTLPANIESFGMVCYNFRAPSYTYNRGEGRKVQAVWTLNAYVNDLKVEVYVVS